MRTLQPDHIEAHSSLLMLAWVTPPPVQSARQPERRYSCALKFTCGCVSRCHQGSDTSAFSAISDADDMQMSFASEQHALGPASLTPGNVVKLESPARSPRPASAYSNASMRLREISRKVAKQNKLDVKLGRKAAAVPALPAKQDLLAVTMAAMNAHKKHLYASVCETAALQVFKSMPKVKEPSNQEIERKYNQIDRFWGPAYFMLCLYYFWRVPLSIAYATPIAWGWFEVLCVVQCVE